MHISTVAVREQLLNKGDFVISKLMCSIGVWMKKSLTKIWNSEACKGTGHDLEYTACILSTVFQ